MGNFPNEYPQAGNYIDLTNRTSSSTINVSGILDCGNTIIDIGAGGALLEFVSDKSHQLRTFDALSSNVNPANAQNSILAPLPFVLPLTWNLTLPGTANVTSGSTTVTLSLGVVSNPTSLAGQTFTFAGDVSSGNYLVSTINNAATSCTISPAYGGITTTGVIVTAHPTLTTLGGTAIVTYGSPSVIFSTPQSI